MPFQDESLSKFTLQNLQIRPLKYHIHMDIEKHLQVIFILVELVLSSYFG